MFPAVVYGGHSKGWTLGRQHGGYEHPCVHTICDLRALSSQGHINQPVKDRPRPRDSGLVAWEASWSESKTMKPSDNMLRKEYAQLTRLQRAVNADVASLHANPEAETVYNVRKQQEPTETSPMRRLSPAGYQRRHGEKEDVSTGEALGVRRRNLVEEATAITASGKCRRRRQGDGSGRSTVDGRAAKRVRREGPGPVNIPFDKVRQGCEQPTKLRILRGASPRSANCLWSGG